jgi:hypothetical protein
MCLRGNSLHILWLGSHVTMISSLLVNIFGFFLPIFPRSVQQYGKAYSPVQAATCKLSRCCFIYVSCLFPLRVTRALSYGLALAAPFSEARPPLWSHRFLSTSLDSFFPYSQDQFSNMAKIYTYIPYNVSSALQVHTCTCVCGVTHSISYDWDLIIPNPLTKQQSLIRDREGQSRSSERWIPPCTCPDKLVAHWSWRDLGSQEDLRSIQIGIQDCLSAGLFVSVLLWPVSPPRQSSNVYPLQNWDPESNRWNWPTVS